MLLIFILEGQGYFLVGREWYLGHWEHYDDNTNKFATVGIPQQEGGKIQVDDYGFHYRSLDPLHIQEENY